MEYTIITNYRYDKIQGLNNKGAPICLLSLSIDKSDFTIFKKDIYFTGEPNPVSFQEGKYNTIKIVSDTWSNLTTLVNTAIGLIKNAVSNAHSNADIANMPIDSLETSTDGTIWA